MARSSEGNSLSRDSGVRPVRVVGGDELSRIDQVGWTRWLARDGTDWHRDFSLSTKIAVGGLVSSPSQVPGERNAAGPGRRLELGRHLRTKVAQFVAHMNRVIRVGLEYIAAGEPTQRA